MSGDTPRVLKLADDILRNQGPMPRDEVVAVLAAHIKSFWDPRMRSELTALVNADPNGVDPVVRRAVSILEGVPASMDAES